MKLKEVEEMSGVVSALRIEDVIPFQKLLLCTKDEKSDIGFITGEFLSFMLRNNIPCVLINLSQSFNHYCHLLMKFGVNVRSLKERGLIENIDILKLNEHVLTSKSDDVSSAKEQNTLTLLANDSTLRTLYECIKEAVCKLSRHGQYDGFALFIDEINILLNLGVKDAALERFIHYCCSFCCNNPKFPGCMFVGSQDDPQDPECHQLLTYFEHKADIRVKVEGLSTGYSNDIHGKMLIENKSEKTDSCQKMLFRVEDRGAKLFPVEL